MQSTCMTLYIHALYIIIYECILIIILCVLWCSFGAGIKVPPRIKKRGRPKGHELTTIGLPAKKAKGGKLCAFTKLHTSDKEKRKFSRGNKRYACRISYRVEFPHLQAIFLPLNRFPCLEY